MSLRRLATGFAAMAAATFLAQASGFVVMVVLARRLDPGEIGSYSFALSLVGYFAIPANFGVTGLAIRDLAQRPHEARAIMGDVVALQAVVGFAPYLLLVALAPVLAVDADSRAILPIVGLNFLVEGLSLAWVLLGRSNFVVIAVGRVAGALVFAAGCLLFVHAGPGAVTSLAWVTVAGVTATAVITLAVALRRQGAPAFRPGTRRLVGRFRAGVPLGVAAVMISVYYTADAVMLGYLKDSETVGRYSIAYKIPLAITNIAALWGSVFFPHASTLVQRSRKELREQVGAFASVALVGSLPILAGALLVGHDLMPRLFGAEYTASATPFIILTAAAALVLFTITYGTAQIAIGDERHYAIAVTLGAVTNIAVNLVVIPPFGMVGAAAATLAAEVVVFAYAYARLRKLLGPMPLHLGRITRALAATLVMTAVLLPLDGLTVTLRVLIGVPVFVAAAAVLHVLRPHELRQLWQRDTPDEAVAVGGEAVAAGPDIAAPGDRLAP